VQLIQRQRKQFREECLRILEIDGLNSLACIFDANEQIVEQLYGMMSRPRCGDRAEEYLEKQAEIMFEQQDVIIEVIMTLQILPRNFDRNRMVGLLARYHESRGEDVAKYLEMIARVQQMPEIERPGLTRAAA
jgi:hypothetical protein